MISAQSTDGNQVLQWQPILAELCISLSKLLKDRSLLSIRLVTAIIFTLVLGSVAHAQKAADSSSTGTVASVVSQNKNSSIPVERATKANAVAPSAQSSLEDDEVPPADDGSQDMNVALPEGEAQLRVRISVPHQVRPNSMITLYPYPPRPPKVVRNINKIDDKPKGIRQQLLNIGYSSRSSDSKLFPQAGWRWKYILKAATEKSGTHPPTNILTMYPWTFKMVPYVQAEIRRINEIEADRKVRYQSAMRDFEENGVELENEATQKGLAPIEINLKRGDRKLLSGEAVVVPGTWYVVAAHKTANLKFYWQIPVSISAGERQTIQLTQTNALVIEGAW